MVRVSEAQGESMVLYGDTSLVHSLPVLATKFVQNCAIIYLIIPGLFFLLQKPYSNYNQIRIHVPARTNSQGASIANYAHQCSRRTSAIGLSIVLHSSHPLARLYWEPMLQIFCQASGKKWKESPTGKNDWLGETVGRSKSHL
jgi:hypothetical protein